MTPSGKLKDRITFQTSTVTTTDDGKPTQTWATYATVWAEVTNQRAKEELRGQQEVARADYRIVCRYRSGITETMQILYRTKTLAINSVVEEDHELIIEASEVK